jgi:hypothetical protein
MALEQRDVDSARPMLEEALEIARAAGSRIAVYQALMLSGELSRLEGDLSTAQASIAAALREVRNTGLQPMILTGLRSLAGCRLAMGKAEEALHLLGAEAIARAGASVPSTLCPALAARFPLRYEEDMDLAHQTLSDERFSAAWATGEGTPLDVALADALEGGAA